MNTSRSEKRSAEQNYESTCHVETSKRMLVTKLENLTHWLARTIIVQIIKIQNLTAILIHDFSILNYPKNLLECNLPNWSQYYSHSASFIVIN